MSWIVEEFRLTNSFPFDETFVSHFQIPDFLVQKISIAQTGTVSAFSTANP